ncbi:MULTISPECIES: nucleotide exchange factor GrpE [Thermodesulfovibrio]|jgi:molecular chaperone GrpE|uniref:nucleotide exchange factor GrpE n=1 Tax=Thermodesulfovibrio TaxID=28261 RepID=UPI0026230983|nr:nucleotide exchange factor GrpE [Thermodesulfovibrio sp.]
MENIREDSLSENKQSEELKYEGAAIEDKPRDAAESLQAELAEQKDKYLRLYAEFENYKRMAHREREELINFANEKLIKDLLPVLDNLELALKHASGEDSSKWIESMKKGVENTLKEFFRILEKYGVKPIESLGQPFNPEVHHAVTTVETEEKEENIVVEELRKGYFYKDKLLREPLVAVSKKPKPSEETSSHPSGVENQ